jgi:hypothetical protein
VLRDILGRNATCEYGRRYRFAMIDDIVAYQTRVPMVTYDDLRGDIERIARGDSAVLTTAPVAVFEETGGSAGGAKRIPYTAASFVEFQAGLLPWLHAIGNAVPDALSGPAYWSISPACRRAGATAGGIPIGLTSDAAYFGEAIAQRIAASLVVPPPVGVLEDVALWRRLTLLCLVMCEDLRLISVWSPTFLLDLIDALTARPDTVIRDVAAGVDAATRRICAQAAITLPAPNGARARAFERVLRSRPNDWRGLWPRLVFISCWDQGQAGPYAEEIRRQFPGVLVQGKGLLATEGLVSIPWQRDQAPVLALNSGFYEFLDDDGVAHVADDVDVGADYELLMTTSSGLYRYRIGDRVRIAGMIERSPTIEFLGRSGVSCDLVGEKLEESFVAGVMRNLPVRFRMLVPNDTRRGYALILDAGEIGAEACAGVAASVDDSLQRNPQYQYARKLGQLAPLQVYLACEPAKSWIAYQRARGRRLGDIKLPALYPRRDWRDVFAIPA